MSDDYFHYEPLFTKGIEKISTQLVEGFFHIIDNIIDEKTSDDQKNMMMAIASYSLLSRLSVFFALSVESKDGPENFLDILHNVNKDALILAKEEQKRRAAEK